ncbi:UDP-glucose 4-epimerase [Burkholderia guangdongensis]|uniref:UDP-glucose 4-epimerase n=1 Tax=Burkholderia guangdongensis TaxID=1792500 RepID=UPI0015CC2984|nr:UDP-glucose 4-epimerase [Burkholderia guangdongensis]
MALSGNIREGDWTVEVETIPTGDGGFRCRVRVEHGRPAGPFRHAFDHGPSCPTEREALLEGLRAGMVWIELKASHVFDV